MLFYKNINNSFFILTLICLILFALSCKDSDKKEFEPSPAKWALEQSVGADMVTLDYASNDTVIFHDYFGLFVYDLNKLEINTDRLVKLKDMTNLAHYTLASVFEEDFESTYGLDKINK